MQLEGEFGVIWNDKGSVTYGDLTLPKWKCEETQLVQQASKCLWRKKKHVFNTDTQKTHLNSVNTFPTTITSNVQHRCQSENLSLDSTLFCSMYFTIPSSESVGLVFFLTSQIQYNRARKKKLCLNNTALNQWYQSAWEFLTHFVWRKRYTLRNKEKLQQG